MPPAPFVSGASAYGRGCCPRACHPADRQFSSGNISVEEFAKVMSQSPGKTPSEAEVQQIIKEVDLDGDGQINFNGACRSFAST